MIVAEGEANARTTRAAAERDALQLEGTGQAEKSKSIGLAEAEVTRRTGLATAEVHHDERLEEAERGPEIAIGIEALQHFGEHEVAGDHFILAKQLVEAIGFGGRRTAKIVDPDARIDEDHPPAPSVRIFSRSPVQASLPRHALMPT